MDYADKLVELCRNGELDTLKVLENVLTNYLSGVSANEFISEYGDAIDEFYPDGEETADEETDEYEVIFFS